MYSSILYIIHSDLPSINLMQLRIYSFSHLSIRTSIYPSIHLIYLSTYSSIYSSIYLFICLHSSIIHVSPFIYPYCNCNPPLINLSIHYSFSSIKQERYGTFYSNHQYPPPPMLTPTNNLKMSH